MKQMPYCLVLLHSITRRNVLLSFGWFCYTRSGLHNLELSGLFFVRTTLLKRDQTHKSALKDLTHILERKLEIWHFNRTLRVFLWWRNAGGHSGHGFMNNPAAGMKKHFFSDIFLKYLCISNAACILFFSLECL